MGTSSSQRRNAHEIMWNGDHYVYGLGGYDGTNYADAQTLQEVISGLLSTIETLSTRISQLGRSTETLQSSDTSDSTTEETEQITPVTLE